MKRRTERISRTSFLRPASNFFRKSWHGSSVGMEMKQSMRMVLGPLLLVAALIVARILIPNKMNFITEISIFSIYVMGCNVLYGYLGMVSFGQPFYLGIGAYSAAIYLAYIGTSPLVSIFMGILVGFIVGGVLGPFFVRLRG